MRRLVVIVSVALFGFLLISPGLWKGREARPQPVWPEGLFATRPAEVQCVGFADDGALWIAAESVDENDWDETGVVERWVLDAERQPVRSSLYVVPISDIWNLALSGDRFAVGSGDMAFVAFGHRSEAEVGSFQFMADDGESPLGTLCAALGWAGPRLVCYFDGGWYGRVDTRTREEVDSAWDDGFRYATFDETESHMFIPWGEGNDAVVRRTTDMDVVARLPSPVHHRLYASVSDRLGLAAMSRATADLYLWEWKTGQMVHHVETRSRDCVALEFAHDRRLLVVVWAHEGLEVFDVSEPASMRSVAFEPFPPGLQCIDRVPDSLLSLSPDGRVAAVPVVGDDTTGVWVVHLP